ncbi:CTNS-like protein [Fusarium heterosporum]|uniref:CTNS-like protein n=1 Tax=Fusarium heterosporum TaxID=42747 RepID=A0A8H5TFY6_FUSHE|nr:CTNS-like protein [Fusarium heterosporum]
MARSFLDILSSLFGWVYFFAWSASFYPQPLLNWRRRSTSGTTIDFPFINNTRPQTHPYTSSTPSADHGTRVKGFAAYFSSNVAFYYSPEIRAQYSARHRGLQSTVQFNDITFALHALFLSIVTTSQYLSPALWGFTPNSGNRPSRFILGVAAGCVTGVILTCVIVALSPGNDAVYDWVALDIVYAVGYVKLIVTLIKYTPQIVTNYNNQSTEGWSISQILLDLTGGVLSVSQQAIDSYQQRDWSGITGNPVKFSLGNISMIYDSIFMVQHYVLYRHSEKPQPDTREDERLLQDEERRAERDE